MRMTDEDPENGAQTELDDRLEELEIEVSILRAENAQLRQRIEKIPQIVSLRLLRKSYSRVTEILDEVLRVLHDGEKIIAAGDGLPEPMGSFFAKLREIIDKYDPGVE